MQRSRGEQNTATNSIGSGGGGGDLGLRAGVGGGTGVGGWEGQKGECDMGVSLGRGSWV